MGSVDRLREEGYGLMDPEVLAWEYLGEQEQIDTIRALLHDLRGPVAAILHLAECPGGATDRVMQAIGAQATWMACLVEEALADSSGDEFADFDPREVVDPAVELARHLSTTDIRVDASAGVRVRARPIAFGRALTCVLDNAIRAAGSTGRVVVEIDEDPARERVVISVVDDGPGPGRIPSRTSLGLTTTRAMVAACDGAFRLYAGVDGGAVAEIKLPLVAAMERVAG